MSQAKVDKYKKEKKNRAKVAKRQKTKKVVSVFVGAAVVGAIIGYPLGKVLYKQSVEKREESATIIASTFDYWSQQYWATNYDAMFDFEPYVTEEEAATATDASATDATATDAE